MGWTSIFLGFIFAGFILAAIPKVSNNSLRSAMAMVAIAVLFVGLAFSSVRFVPADRVGIVTKNVLGERMQPGQVIAVEGQIGTQGKVLQPGWHFWYWPVVFDLSTVELTEVKNDEVGLIEAVDGEPLSRGQVFADELEFEEFKKMIDDPLYFLGDGNGQKGPQTTVLTPGQYRINTELFSVVTVPQTQVAAGTVAVLKSNVGEDPSIRMEGVDEAGNPTLFLLADRGEKGVRAEPLQPGKHPLNPKAFEVNVVSTERRVANYTASERAGAETLGAITVKSKDGFNFPVDVRVVYYIQPEDAARVVALLGGDNQKLQQLLTSRVRSIFRDNAESVSALDYVNQRSVQARNAAATLRTAMKPYGITIESVDIGEVGSEETLGELLDTQRRRKLAEEQEQTLQLEQRAAEQQKELERIQQEATEERRLATATYEVSIAEQQKQRQILAAEAEAEAIAIRAQAQAEAFRVIAEQIGSGNAALMELLQTIGDKGINITPRVMVVGDGGNGNGNGQDANTTALIGTMLDTMVTRDERSKPGG
ncbi:MAG: SPFH domain-containing protein [Planctomycetota bacterium]